MAKYTLVRSELWSDQKVGELSLPAKALYNYILTSPVSNLAGYYTLQIIQIKANLCRYNKELGEFNAKDEELFKKEVLPELKSQKCLWKYDPVNEQILIPKYLKYNKVGGSSQLTAVARAVKTLKVCELHIDFLYALHKYVGTAACDYIDRDILKKVLKMAKEKETPEALYISSNLKILT